MDEKIERTISEPLLWARYKQQQFLASLLLARNHPLVVEMLKGQTPPKNVVDVEVREVKDMN